MDRGILSEKKLLAASRDFVCARLTTYADDEEGAFLKTIGGTRTGTVLNTTFVLLAPDGKTPLSGAGRSPRQAFRGDEDETVDGLVSAMKTIAKEYPGNGADRSNRPIPYAIDVRNAVNVASCDNQPLVILSISNERVREAVESQLSPLIWESQFRGRFAFAYSESREDLKSIKEVPEEDGILIVQPGTYGLSGKVIAKTTQSDSISLKRFLEQGLSRFKPNDKSNAVLIAGVNKGLEWESESIGVRTENPKVVRNRTKASRKGKRQRRAN